MADALGMTFPIPLPVIMQDEKDYAEAEAWKQYQEESLQLQEAALEQQIEYNQKGDIFAMNQIDLLGDIADKPAVKQNKEKQVKIWDKILKNKTFEGIWKGIKGIASSLSSGFMDMILGLMVWAFLDPDGSLMISLINILVSLSVMVIRMFAKMIPVVLRMIIKVLPVILKAIMTIIDTVIDVLPEVIEAVIKMLPIIWKMLETQVPIIIGKLMDAVVLILHKIGDHFPMLKPLLDLIERFAISIKTLFDPNSPLGIKERLLIFAKTLLIIFGEALLKGLQALIPLLGDLLVSLKDFVMESLNEMGNSIHSYLLEHLGAKGMRALEGFGIALGVIVGTMLAGAFAAGIWVAGIYLWTAAMWIKNVAILAGIPAILSFAAGVWATISPLLLIVLAVIAVIAVFVLLYTFWDEIAEWFGKAWNWFLDNAIDMLMTGIRLLMLPFTWPLETGWFIYKNWEKMKKKLDPIIKLIMDKLNQFINSIADGFKNLKNVSIGDILYNAFNSALHGIPELLRKYFSNIPGADTLRKGFEALEKWFKKSIFYAGLEKAGLVGGNKKNEPVVFNQDLFSKMDTGLGIMQDSRNQKEAAKLLQESGVSAESLKHILMGGKVSDLNLDNEKQQKLTAAIKDLEKSFGGADKFKQEVSQNIADNKDVLKVLEKIASKKEFQSVIGSMGNATMKNATGN